MSASNGKSYKNRVLSSLPAAEIQRLAPHLSPVVLKKNRTLHEAGETVDTVYFLEEGLCSIVVALENGSMVEVGITGACGFVGEPAVLGTGQSPDRAFMQIGGHGFSVKARVLREQAEEPGELRVYLHRAVQGAMVQSRQTAACNRVHSLEELLARWLLCCHDRVREDRLPITHEFLAMMLGTRRTSVTVAAGILQKAGLISYTHGHVTIQDYKGLRDASCECYQVIHDEYVRLGLL
jgi:CRP-like cAMP-binding protein